MQEVRQLISRTASEEAAVEKPFLASVGRRPSVHKGANPQEGDVDCERPQRLLKGVESGSQGWHGESQRTLDATTQQARATATKQ